ncbi:hypothetical protein JTE90_007965 [Oedothorax gibbosus]|uniref:Uncharacterized protein n=1 Tax=Oedothorax gibbosus TaxID=931172 RepID=A0AAV6TF79_9ARAC|nr:hypothetical protein JTE90_007965 [Oedothorax gibbosus]
MLPNKNGGASSVNMESAQHKGVPNVSLNSQGVGCKDKEIPTASNSQREQGKDDLTVIDHMTLEDTLRVLKSDNVLSELDDDLKNVKAGKKTIKDHKEYFKTQVDKKLKQLCLMYSPNSPKWHSMPEEERPKAQAMQAKLNDIRKKEFQPEKDFYEKVAEVQMNFLRTMKNLGDEFCKDLRQYNEQLYEVHLERNEVVSEMCEQIREQGEFYKQASELCEQASESCRQDSEFLIGHLEREKAASAEREERLKKMLESIKKKCNKPSCSSSSQQQPTNQADDQPGPSRKLDGIQPISRSQSLDSLHSDDSGTKIGGSSQCL